jgi:restriction endonuclease S subunit
MKIQQIAKQIRREEKIDPDKEYKILGLRLEGRGLFLREQKFGREIKADRLFQVKKGDFIYSRLFGWRGAFDIVSEQFDNCYVSSEFPTFILDQKQVEPEYLLKYFLLPSVLKKVEILCTGTTKASRNRFKEDKFLSFEIVLPLLNEQVRIKNKLKKFSNENKSFNQIQEDSLLLVSSLRQAILQEAVSGKLIPQDPKDEPASELLKKMKAEKEKLIKEKRITKEKSSPPITEKEIHYELPNRWKWVRLSEIGEIIGGGTPSTQNPKFWSDTGIHWLTPADLYHLKSKYISKGRRDISELGLKNSSAQLLPKGTVLFSSRAPIGYVAIAANQLSTNQGFKSVIPYIMGMNDFIYYFLIAVAEAINNSASGTTFREISGGKMQKILFPLPPFAEQKRIVAKVDQLMKLCDELGTNVKENQKNSELLMQAVLRENFQE